MRREHPGHRRRGLAPRPRGHRQSCSSAQPDIEVVALVDDLPSLLDCRRRGSARRGGHRHPHAPDRAPTKGIQAATRAPGDASRRSASSCCPSTPSRPTPWPLLDGGSERRAYLLKERISDPDRARRTRSAKSRGAGRSIDPKVVEVLVTARSQARTSPLDPPHAPRSARCSPRSPRARTTRRSAASLGAVRAGRREAHQLAVRQARALRGAPAHRRVKAVLLYLAEDAGAQGG